MSIRLIWLLLYLRHGFVRSHVVCMGKEVNDEMITVNCTVDDFVSDIDIKFPNKTGGAYCSVPGPVNFDTQRDCKCNLTSPGDCTITQDIRTKTTTIQIRKTSFTGMFGWYTCAHGSFKKTIMVDRHCACRPDNVDDIIYKTNYFIGASVLGTFGLASVIWTCVYSNVLCRWAKRVSHYFYSKQNQKGSSVRPNVCDTCTSSFFCQICFDCTKMFCDTCCVHHIKSNPAHRVCHVQHIAQCKLEINCHCNIKPADRWCVECFKPFCISCGTCYVHGKSAMRKIYEGTLDSTRKITATGEENLEKIVSESISVTQTQDDEFPVHICGIGFLENGTLMMVDSNNRHITVFHPKNASNRLREKLGNEPRAMTTMTGSEIAITFPYNEEIQIYNIISDENEDSMTVIKGKTICLSSIGLDRLKPFSIAFDNDVFAVEVGEGEDGTIAIIACNEDKTYSVKHKIKPYAFFTGHTIRLALDMTNEGQIFVSAMGIKTVSCINFNNIVKWRISVPSPRSIIIIPDEYSPGKNIIMSSRRCNDIYRLNPEKLDYEILRWRGHISSPRYIAYHEKGNKLCVQVVKDINEYELAIFQIDLKIYEQPEANSPMI